MINLTLRSKSRHTGCDLESKQPVGRPPLGLPANKLDGGGVSGKRSLVRSGTTVDQMVRAIADRIVTGYLRPGERLDEVSLAARFDVSRTPVREALGHLSAIGLVERRPNRGA